MHNETVGNLAQEFDYPALVKVEPLSDYCLKATFSSGEVKKVDVKPYFKYAFFEPIKDYALFNKAYVEYGAVAWNDKIDIAEEALYDKGVTVANNH